MFWWVVGDLVKAEWMCFSLVKLKGPVVSFDFLSHVNDCQKIEKRHAWHFLMVPRQNFRRVLRCVAMGQKPSTQVNSQC